MTYMGNIKICPLHQGDIDHTLLLWILIQEIILLLCKSLYSSPQTYSVGLRKRKNGRKSWNYIKRCLPIFKSYLYCTKETSTGRTTPKHLCVDFQAIDSLLPPQLVKAHSKGQNVLSSVMKYMLMLNGLAFYSSLSCTCRTLSHCSHFQQLINEVLIGLPFTFGYLDDILVLKIPWKIMKNSYTLRNCV